MAQPFNVWGNRIGMASNSEMRQSRTNSHSLPDGPEIAQRGESRPSRGRACYTEFGESLRLTSCTASREELARHPCAISDNSTPSLVGGGKRVGCSSGTPARGRSGTHHHRPGEGLPAVYSMTDIGKLAEIEVVASVGDADRMTTVKAGAMRGTSNRRAIPAPGRVLLGLKDASKDMLPVEQQATPKEFVVAPPLQKGSAHANMKPEQSTHIRSQHHHSSLIALSPTLSPSTRATGAPAATTHTQPSCSCCDRHRPPREPPQVPSSPPQ
ncbi:hypothetical protein NA57DRAFT_58537 [Rhizodiscina lignyota]|uniref:Uncharacterized protein n=1 Tax=Rhizodiscina lignyota TaxID=1504668 RepID=A0A9P4I7W0_9PEZI|nr:hypothetical protein NA57DRAFT_58537 [Rhizodiscina lignyota]